MLVALSSRVSLKNILIGNNVFYKFFFLRVLCLVFHCIVLQAQVRKQINNRLLPPQQRRSDIWERSKGEGQEEEAMSNKNLFNDFC